MIDRSAFVHATAIVDEGAAVGKNSKVWHFCHLRAGARLGDDVSLARDVYVDTDVAIGAGSRVQNGVSLYSGIKIGRWCFVGPHAIFTNDPRPRVGRREWKKEETRLEDGMSIGAGAIIRCGLTIGAFSMIGAGAVITKDVPPFTLVVGFPGEPSARICACGEAKLPIDASREALIQPCCQSALLPEVLELAKAYAAKTGY